MIDDLASVDVGRLFHDPASRALQTGSERIHFRGKRQRHARSEHFGPDPATARIRSPFSHT